MVFLLVTLYIICFGVLFAVDAFSEERWYFRLFTGGTQVSNSEYKSRKHLDKATNRFSFKLCMFVAVISLINGIVSYFYPRIVDLGLIYIIFVSVLIWPIRSVYRKSYNAKKILSEKP